MTEPEGRGGEHVSDVTVHVFLVTICKYRGVNMKNNKLKEVFVNCIELQLRRLANIYSHPNGETFIVTWKLI